MVMKQEQEEIAEVLLELGMDERLISFMTNCHVHKELDKQRKK